eukprot:7105600-Prymnesium_polylepis.1
MECAAHVCVEAIAQGGCVCFAFEKCILRICFQGQRPADNAEACQQWVARRPVRVEKVAHAKNCLEAEVNSPPIDMIDNVTADLIGSKPRGIAGAPLSSGRCRWHAPRLPL